MKDITTKPKRCWSCKKSYPATAKYFHRNSRETNGLHSQCKICKNQKNRVYAVKHRISKPRINLRASNNLHKQHIKDLGCCICCGEQRPEVLQFHHREPEDKLFALNDSGSRDLEEIKAEIAKCDLMCANCHISLHYWERHK